MFLERQGASLFLLKAEAAKYNVTEEQPKHILDSSLNALEKEITGYSCMCLGCLKMALL